MTKDFVTSEPHICVDLDGTLAFYDEWVEITHIGEPIKPMVDRVKKWLKKGIKVKIFTARLDHPDRERIISIIQDWTEKNIGKRLEVTDTKDYSMVQFWDDRAIQVITNTGLTLAEYLERTQEPHGLPVPVESEDK